MTHPETYGDPSGRRDRRGLLRKGTAAAFAVAATAALGMTVPAAAQTPETTRGLEPMTACMTAHQACVWEKAVVSVPAVVLVPPRICP
jgi:hypothetical protein